MTSNSHRGGLKVRTWTELLALPKPDFQYIVEPQLLAYGGNMVLYGPAETFKTFLAIELVYSITSGSRWLGVFDTRPVPTLTVQVEEPEPMYQGRIEAFTRQRPTVPELCYFATDQSLKLDGFLGAGLLDIAIKEHGIKLVIVDCMYKVVTGSTSDENNQKRLLEQIDTLRSKHGCAFVIIHHPRKDQSDNYQASDKGMEEMLGSGVLNFWADTIIKVSHNSRLDDLLLMQFQKARHAVQSLPDLPIHIDRGSLQFKVDFTRIAG